MAQRSARGRIALEKKISSQTGGAPSQQQHQQQNTLQPGGVGGIPPTQAQLLHQQQQYHHSGPITTNLPSGGGPIHFGGALHNISASTTFNPSTGLITPSASSIATGSSGYSSTHLSHPGSTGGGAGGGRHGFAFISKNAGTGRKSALRAILEGHSDKIRGRLGDAIRNRGSANNNNAGGSGGSNSNTSGSGYNLGGSGSKKLGDMRENKLLSVKRWEFNGKAGVAGWDKIQRDPELWLADGDTLVYLSPQGHPAHQFSQPSFRIRSSVLKETNSPFWATMLIERKNTYPSPPRTQPPPRQAPAPLNLENLNLSNSGTLNNINRPPTPSTPTSPVSLSRMDSIERVSSIPEQLQHHGSNTYLATEGVKYEIYLPAPLGLSKEQVLKYHLTTRNVFAVLFGASLVGVTLGETLLDLVDRLESYIPPSESRLQHRESSATLDGNNRKRKNIAVDTAGVKGNVGRVLEYLLNREFDDFRNCPEVAAGILCFAEKFQLSELWREAFCHCVGMLNQMEGGKEYMEISPITKALIDRASLEIQVRIGQADERLAAFQFDDIWPVSSFSWSPSRVAFDRFQKFLVKHYQSRFGAWPPPLQKNSESVSGWGGAFGLGSGGSTAGAGFTRQIYIQLQRDFAALYDYLVDRDVSWSYPLGEPQNTYSPVGPGMSTSTLGSMAGQGMNSSRNKPKLVSPNKRHFRADEDNLPMTDILLSFDNANGFPHIPHPYPLVPELRNFHRQGTAGGQGNPAPTPQKHGFLQKRNSYLSSNNASPSPAAMAAADKAAALALTDSTNIHSLLSSKASNELVDAFAKHEKEKSNGEFTPSEGRKGRWLLIYGVLQTLATVSGDAQGLRYTDGVEYFLNTKLKGTPPWVSAGAPVEDGPGGIDDHHTRSHCWSIVRSWENPQNANPWTSEFRSLTPVSSILSGQSTISGKSVHSSSAPPRTSGENYNNSSSAGPTSRSIGVGAGDATDTDTGYQSNSRTHGGRKRKAIPVVMRTASTETSDPQKLLRAGRKGRRGGHNMSGDEGDDEADEEDEDIVMGDHHHDREIPILEQEVELDAVDTSTAIRASSGKGKERGEFIMADGHSMPQNRFEVWGMQEQR
ncbi:hypothetical protein DFH27DRAFT_233634 [Peziza echinospora]|nr:hypothetical protein DFH27DRAFT_233634 [Peziza echinospora]